MSGYDDAEPAYAERGMRPRSPEDRVPVSSLLDQVSDELSTLLEQIEKHVHLIGPVLRPEEAEDGMTGDLARVRLHSPLAERLLQFREQVRDARLRLGHATERIDL